jgi:hypothetical protein
MMVGLRRINFHNLDRAMTMTGYLTFGHLTFLERQVISRIQNVQ